MFDDLFNDGTILSDYRSEVWRVVESQETAATLQLVDDLAEQALLEDMLDVAKPPYRHGTEEMHYLLKTAFRYPPLRWGSRFGTTLMPSYFYASEESCTALTECAYYRFLFLDHISQPYDRPIRSEYSLFRVLLRSDSCLDLTHAKFRDVGGLLGAPSSYAYSQRIGQWALDRGDIDLLRFESVRDSAGINVAVAKPSVIHSKVPSIQQRWLCLTKKESVSFSSRESELSYVFSLRDFCGIDGRLLTVS